MHERTVCTILPLTENALPLQSQVQPISRFDRAIYTGRKSRYGRNVFLFFLGSPIDSGLITKVAAIVPLREQHFTQHCRDTAETPFVAFIFNSRSKNMQFFFRPGKSNISDIQIIDTSIHLFIEILGCVISLGQTATIS